MISRYLWEVFFIENIFSYAILPLKLIEAEEYKSLSSKEILLYSLLLNRTNISKLNNRTFRDEKGYFVFYTNKQITEHLRCSKDSATLALKRLEHAGLIRREYTRKGLPMKIYVNDIRGVDKTFYRKKEPKSSAIHNVSFDIEKAEALSKINRGDFGTKKNKRRTRNTGSAL